MAKSLQKYQKFTDIQDNSGGCIVKVKEHILKLEEVSHDEEGVKRINKE